MSCARFLQLAINSCRSPAESQELACLLAGERGEILYEFAHRAGVGPLAASVLGDSQGGVWSKCRKANASRVNALLEAVADVSTRFESKEILTAVIEGGGVLLSGGYREDAYCAGDVDYLVERGSLQKVRRCLEGCGFFKVPDSSEVKMRQVYTRSSSAGNLRIEVGSSPFERGLLPIVWAERTKIWLERRRRSEVRPEIFTLDPTDALILVCVHASLHSFVRSPGLRLYADIDRSAQHPNVDWDVFVNEAQRSGLSRRVFLALSIAKALLGTLVPEGVIDELAPPKYLITSFSRLLGRVDLSAPQSWPWLRLLMLDALVTDRGIISWLSALIFPPAGWYADMSVESASRGLHRRRWAALLRRNS